MKNYLYDNTKRYGIMLDMQNLLAQYASLYSGKYLRYYTRNDFGFFNYDPRFAPLSHSFRRWLISVNKSNFRKIFQIF